MEPNLDDYSVINPETEAEVAEVLDEREDVLPLAGGTDLFVSMKRGDIDSRIFLNLQSCADFEVEPELGEELTLSPLTTFKAVRDNRTVSNKYPLLQQAARNLGVLAIQNRATWAGNVVNASPCANGTAGLMAYDAQLELASVDGQRRVHLTDFYQGYKDLGMKENEYVRAIHVPGSSPGWEAYYRDVGARNQQAVSKTLLVGRLRLDTDNTVADIRLVAGSVAPRTLRLVQTEAVISDQELSPDLIDAACETLQEEIAPIDDIRSDQRYRRRVTENLLREFLEQSQPDR